MSEKKTKKGPELPGPKKGDMYWRKAVLGGNHGLFDIPDKVIDASAGCAGQADRGQHGPPLFEELDHHDNVGNRRSQGHNRYDNDNSQILFGETRKTDAHNILPRLHCLFLYVPGRDLNYMHLLVNGPSSPFGDVTEPGNIAVVLIPDESLGLTERVVPGLRVPGVKGAQ